MAEEIYRVLGRIEGKLDAVSEDIKETRGSLARHGQRITALEGTRAKFLGIVSAVGFAFSFAAVWLREKIFG